MSTTMNKPEELDYDIAFPLKLNKPVVLFDTETTGLNVDTDRITQLAALVITPEGKTYTYDQLFDPTIPISPEASEITGYTNKDLEDCPVFSDIGDYIHSNIFYGGNCHLVAFNLKFDLAIIRAEFGRCGLELELHDCYAGDPFEIFKKDMRHTLESAHEYYLGGGFDGAHNAMADVMATMNVLKAQIEQNNITDMQSLDARSGGLPNPYGGFLEPSGDGYIIKRGKYQDKYVRDVAIIDKKYLQWMLGDKASFNTATKNAIRRVLTSLRPDDTIIGELTFNDIK